MKPREANDVYQESRNCKSRTHPTTFPSILGRNNRGLRGVRNRMALILVGFSSGELCLVGNFPHRVICNQLPILRCAILVAFCHIEMNTNSQINNMHYLWATATCFGNISVFIIRLCKITKSKLFT
jgi:hypothetical protein